MRRAAGTNDLTHVLSLQPSNATAKQELVRQTTLGCISILQDLVARLPHTKLLVMSILPRGLDSRQAEKYKQHIPTLYSTNYTLPNMFTPVIDETNRQVQVSALALLQLHFQSSPTRVGGDADSVRWTGRAELCEHVERVGFEDELPRLRQSIAISGRLDCEPCVDARRAPSKPPRIRGANTALVSTPTPPSWVQCAARPSCWS